MMGIRNFTNTATIGTLTAPVASSAVVLTVTGFTGLPAVPFTATVDRNTVTEEIVLVTAIAGTSFTVTRGYDGTAAIAHLAGATIEHTAGAIDYTEANAHVNATTAVHGVTGSLVGAQGAQSIFDKTFVSPVLQADATAGDAAVSVVPPSAPSRNLWRGVGTDGLDKITVDKNGKVFASALDSSGNASLHGTLTVDGAQTFTGVTTHNGALNANQGITVPATKTAAVDILTAGATTVTTLAATGLVSLNNSATVPTGKKITVTDAPATSTDAANKGYIDGLFSSPPAARAVPKSFGSVTSFPTGVIVGDTCYRSDYAATFTYNGTGWFQTTWSVYASNAARDAVYTSGVKATLPEGFRIWHTALRTEQRWDVSSAKWRFRLMGTQSATTDVNGILPVIAHGAGQAPAAWGVSKSGQSTDSLNTYMQPLAYLADATNLTVRVTRSDASTYLASTAAVIAWWADF